MSTLIAVPGQSSGGEKSAQPGHNSNSVSKKSSEEESDQRWETWRSDNARNWDARARLHRSETTKYHTERKTVISGGVTLQPHEVSELEKVVGPTTSVLHLQCHVGTDTLSLLHMGAKSVVGLDFSKEATLAAAQLAADAKLSNRARWVVSDVYDAPAALKGETFDLVYVSIGSLCWLPDIKKWASIVGACLKPGGHLYVRDTHPMAGALASDDETPGFMQRPKDQLGARDMLLAFPYYERKTPLTFADEWSYDGDGKLPSGSCKSHEWNHPLGSIITAIIQQGSLSLKYCLEHQVIDWRFQDHMVRDEEFEGRGYGGWRLPAHIRDRCPLTFSILAQRPKEALR